MVMALCQFLVNRVRNVCLLAVKCYSDNVGETFATAMRQTSTVALVQRLRVNLIIVVKLVLK